MLARCSCRPPGVVGALPVLPLVLLQPLASHHPPLATALPSYLPGHHQASGKPADNVDVQLMPFGGAQARTAPSLALTAGSTMGNSMHNGGAGGGGSAAGSAAAAPPSAAAAEGVDAAADAVVATHALRGCAGLGAVPSGAAQLLAWPGLLLDALQVATMPQVGSRCVLCVCACLRVQNMTPLPS